VRTLLAGAHAQPPLPQQYEEQKKVIREILLTGKKPNQNSWFKAANLTVLTGVKAVISKEIPPWEQVTRYDSTKISHKKSFVLNATILLEMMKKGKSVLIDFPDEDFGTKSSHGLPMDSTLSTEEQDLAFTSAIAKAIKQGVQIIVSSPSIRVRNSVMNAVMNGEISKEESLWYYKENPKSPLMERFSERRVIIGSNAVTPCETRQVTEIMTPYSIVRTVYLRRR